MECIWQFNPLAAKGINIRLPTKMFLMNRNLFTSFAILVVFLLNLNCAVLSGQKISAEILKSFKTGDVELLSRHFNNRVSLNILDKEYDPSQAQAKEIMREFFRNNPPLDFNLKFESIKSDSRFFIGILYTSRGKYRVNIFLRSVDGRDLIHLLRIEREDESAF